MPRLMWFWMYFLPMMLVLVQPLDDVAKNANALLTATLPLPITLTESRAPLPVTEQPG